MGTWIGSNPLTSGRYLAFRTNNSHAQFDDLKVTADSGVLSYFYTDHLGSTSVLSDVGGNQVVGSAGRYKPFGGYRTTPTAGITDRGFTGHRHKDPIGLVYMGARYYVPSIGRFVSADTIVPDLENPQQFNRYSYVNNNPLKFVDPSGHRACVEATECDEWVPADMNTVKYRIAYEIALEYYRQNFILPFEGTPPVTGGLSQDHPGTDWGGQITVRAPAAGTVTSAGPDNTAGMWRIQEKGTDTIREWSVFDTATERALRGQDTDFLEPEQLLATGQWEDIAPGWSHTEGQSITIDHGHNLETHILHTVPTSSIAKGVTVNQGESLGAPDNIGWSTGIHLHYDVQFTYMDRTSHINPLAPYLNR